MTRARGEGSIRRRSDGRWEGRYWTPDGYRRSVFGRTQSETARKLGRKLEEREQGIEPPTAQETVAGYLRGWLAGIQPTLRPQTFAAYERLVRLHLIPQLGRTRLLELRPLRVQQLYARLLQQGLDPKTVRNVHGVLHRALEQAVRWRQLSTNVADLVDPPRLVRKELRVLDAEQVRRLLAAAQGDPLEALYTLALSLGLRQGELLGLRWQDLDLEVGSLRVNASVERASGLLAEPKTQSSRRQIRLSPRLLGVLRRHRERSGPVLPTAFLFPRADGSPLSASTLYHRWRALTVRAGVPQIAFHGCRHTAATQMLERGVNPKTVSQVLGHASFSITADIYAHVTPWMEDQAAAAMDALLGPETDIDPRGRQMFGGQYGGQNRQNGQC